MKKLNLNGEILTLEIGTYRANNHLAVISHCEDGEPFSDVTINLAGTFRNYIDEAFIDPINKDCGLYQLLINKGIIKEVLKENVQYNMGHYDLVRFDLDKLKEYDPKGYERYLNTIGFEEEITRFPKI